MRGSLQLISTADMTQTPVSNLCTPRGGQYIQLVGVIDSRILRPLQLEKDVLAVTLILT